MNLISKYILTLTIIFVGISKSYTQKPSKAIEVSIITCGEGYELYSAFGHSAIRVKDSAHHSDYVYNYGAFNFNTPNFYVKFARGKLDYMLSVSHFRYFINSYKHEKRWVNEQVLNLSDIQAKKVSDFLRNNAKPENKYYRYDFFFDNCATRVKDVLKISLGDELILGKTKSDSLQTFRDLIYLYLDEREWGRFGINMALGMPTDKIATNEQASFLPDNLETLIANTQIIIDGKKETLVKENRVLLKKQDVKFAETPLITPFRLFWALFVFVFFLTAIEFKKNKRFAIVDSLLFFVTGLFGIVLLLLWFATDHSTTINNLNTLWAIPFHLVAVFFLLRKKKVKFIKIYFGITAIFGIFIILFSWLIPQTYDIAVLPIVLILTTRASWIYWNFNKII